MNIFELAWLLLTIICGAYGVSFGQQHFGTLGFFIGGVAGAAIGMGVAWIIALILSVIFKMIWGGEIFKPRKSTFDKNQSTPDDNGR